MLCIPRVRADHLGAEMKSLLSILAIGLMLPPFTDSTKLNLEKKFTKLCDRKFIAKVLQICKQSDQEILLPRNIDYLQISDSYDTSEDMSVEEAERMYDDDEIQQRESQYALRPSISDNSQHQEAPDDFSDHASETEEDSTMEYTLPTKSVGRKLRKRRLSISDRCCKSTCNVRQILRICFW
ncbi:hypothetical protein scyTo_0001311 [Scyliorhinus torazame]|uniref:Uncharacterized protein n=1 Tax=Scyliorhinus torazame TaxID=75743 RepID=A0A401PBS4_SCYTO|nr:hypothetical protein [Scyliorhinus torazame]